MAGRVRLSRGKAPIDSLTHPTDAGLAELVGPRSKTRPARRIPLQIRACCICTTKCLECRDSQLGAGPQDATLALRWCRLRDMVSRNLSAPFALPRILIVAMIAIEGLFGLDAKAQMGDASAPGDSATVAPPRADDAIPSRQPAPMSPPRSPSPPPLPSSPPPPGVPSVPEPVSSGMENNSGITHGPFGGLAIATMSEFYVEDEASHVFFQPGPSRGTQAVFAGYEVLHRDAPVGVGGGASVTLFRTMNFGTVQDDGALGIEARNTKVTYFMVDLLGYIFPLRGSELAIHLRFGLGAAHLQYDFVPRGPSSLYTPGQKTTTGIAEDVGVGIRIPTLKHVAFLVEGRWFLMKTTSHQCEWNPCSETSSTYAPMYSLALLIN
jgi:hypothetical protein